MVTYEKMYEKHRRQLLRILRKRAAGTLSQDDFHLLLDRMMRQEDRAAAADQFGSGFLADLATDLLRRSGLSESDDLWPWIESTFRTTYAEFWNSDRCVNAARLACLRVFGKATEQTPQHYANTQQPQHNNR